MRATGIIRRIDELGRVTLPIEIRRSMNLSERDGLEIFVEGDGIILKKAEIGDIFSGEQDDLFEYKGKKVSRASIIELAHLIGLNVIE